MYENNIIRVLVAITDHTSTQMEMREGRGKGEGRMREKLAGLFIRIYHFLENQAWEDEVSGGFIFKLIN